jgi:hypothetical protein
MQNLRIESPVHAFDEGQATIIERVSKACDQYAGGKLHICDASDEIERALETSYRRELRVFGRFQLPDRLASMDVVNAIPMHYAMACLQRDTRRCGPWERPVSSLARQPRVKSQSTTERLIGSSASGRPQHFPERLPRLAECVAQRYGCTVRIWVSGQVPGPPVVFQRDDEKARSLRTIDLLYKKSYYHLLPDPKVDSTVGVTMPPVTKFPGPGRGLPLALMFALNIANFQDVVAGLADGPSAALRCYSEELRKSLVEDWFKELGYAG